MGFVAGDAISVKGPVPYCLDLISTGAGARPRLDQLRDAILKLGPGYQGLETVFYDTILAWQISDHNVRKDIRDHLKSHWFDNTSSSAYFGKTDVVQIYARGVLKAIELSLYGASDPVPLDTWWVPESNDVKMAALATVERGVTVSPTVTLLILTPRPNDAAGLKKPTFYSTNAQAWATDDKGVSGSVMTWKGWKHP